MAVIKSGSGTDQWDINSYKAGKILLYDSSGNVIQSVLDTSGKYNVGVASVQNVIASTKNSSTAKIVSGAEWVGTVESTLGVAAIQINTYIDKTHQVTLYQSMDGTNFDITDVWTDPASYGNSRTVQATASYYKLGVKNLAGTDTTIVRIQTALCPSVEALPRALTSGGNLRISIAPDWQSARRITGLYGVSSFRTLGAASSPQNIFTIENPAASLVSVAVRQLTITSDSTAVLVTVAQQIETSRTSGLPTGGTALTAVKFDTTFGAANAICRGGTASDGGLATAITATAGAIIWQQFLDRPHTVVGWAFHPVYNLVPDIGTDLRQIRLAAGEALLVQGVTSIPATTHMIVQCSWSEMTVL